MKERVSSKESLMPKVKLAPGIPPLVLDIFKAAKSQPVETYLTPEQAAAMQKYYSRKYLGRRKYEPNFSLSDIEDEEEKNKFSALIESSILALSQALPEAQRVGLPQDNMWFLKGVDTSRSYKLKKLWEDPEYRATHTEILQKVSRDPDVSEKKSKTSKEHWTADSQRRERYRELTANRWQDPEFRARAKAAMKGRKHTKRSK